MGYIRVEVQELISNVLLITMGVEFTALFGHNLPEDVILKGENFLNHHWGGTQEYLPILDACPVPDSPIPLWQWDKRWGYSPQEDLQKYGFISFVSDGFRARIGENTFYLWNVVRWHRFLTEERISTTLRHICQLLATILQTDKVIYLPDSGFSVSTVYDLMYENVKFEAILQWLQNNCGPPANTLIDIYPNDYDPDRGNGYFVDTFPLI